MHASMPSSGRIRWQIEQNGSTRVRSARHLRVAFDQQPAANSVLAFAPCATLIIFLHYSIFFRSMWTSSCYVLNSCRRSQSASPKLNFSSPSKILQDLLVQYLRFDGDRQNKGNNRSPTRTHVCKDDNEAGLDEYCKTKFKSKSMGLTLSRP
jgi:hypothetical protein